MRILIICVIAIILVFALVSCGKDGAVVDSTPSPEPTPTITLTPTPTPTPMPTTTPKPIPTSYTTGLPFDGDYLPIIVSIDNSSAARPQFGLQKADIVYEVPVEGSATRFVCVFSDILPEKVKPVRSARVPFLYIVHEYNAPFMHWGGAGSNNKSGGQVYNVYSHHLRDKTYDIDGMSGKWPNTCYKEKGTSGYHNVVGNVLLAQEIYDYKPEPLGWLFDENVEYSGDTVKEIELKLCTKVKNYVSYTYDELNEEYLRSMQGKEFISAETGEQISVTNLILQYCSFSIESGKYKMWKLTGSGKAEFYIGGKFITGTWQRKSEDALTVFYNNIGEQIVLKPGNTWVHICPEE